MKKSQITNQHEIWERMDLINRVICCGENKRILTEYFPDECIDLIYLDPPFFSNRHYEILWGNGAESRVYEDRWKGGIEHYVGWMIERLRELHRVLKDTGSIYLHCDWHAAHYLKIEMDRIFGEKNFQNDIVWCYKTREFSKKHWNRKHDDILYYVKDIKSKFTFNWDADGVIESYSPQTIKKYKYKDEKGCYRLVGRGIKGSPIQSAKDVSPEWEKTHPELVKRNYLKKGYAPSDYWYIDIINQASKERLGYPTQKPEALLEKIIKTSSNKGDLVLDPFVGGGTTLVVAEKLKRRWTGIDVSPIAMDKIKENFARYSIHDYKIIGAPANIEDLRSYTPEEFQYWVINAVYGNPSRKMTSDYGVDGYTYFDQNPIQVKQSDGVGRNTVDNFETAIRRLKKNKGEIYAFSFTKGAYGEVARAKREEKLEIKLITIAQLLKKTQNYKPS